MTRNVFDKEIMAIVHLYEIKEKQQMCAKDMGININTDK